MDLKEIVNRPIETMMEEEDAYLVLKEYVKVRKGVDIQPKIGVIFGRFGAMHEVNLMHQMLCEAIGWFRQNPDKMK